MRRLLAIRDVRIYLAGQSLSLLGDTALWLALAVWAKDLTGSSSAAGLVILCVMAPQLLSPLSGLLVDRVRRRPLLLIVNLVTAGVVLLLLAAGDRVWMLYAVGAVYGAS
jgi:MFS family permease